MVALNGIYVYPFSSVDELLNYVTVEKKILVAINAEKILHATEQTRNIINCNIGYADGIGAVMGLRKKGYKNSIKIPGCELWLKIVDRFYNSKTFYLVGSKQDVIEEVVQKLRKKYSGIDIVNYRNGYLNNTEKELLMEDIKAKKPDIVFVAMGSPVQEILMSEMLSVHPAIYQGLGGSFDVYTNNVKRAPEWWIDNNLEWAYRLLKQPTRIKRQIHLLRFMSLLLLNRL